MQSKTCCEISKTPFNAYYAVHMTIDFIKRSELRILLQFHVQHDRSSCVVPSNFCENRQVSAVLYTSTVQPSFFIEDSSLHDLEPCCLDILQSNIHKIRRKVFYGGTTTFKIIGDTRMHLVSLTQSLLYSCWSFAISFHELFRIVFFRYELLNFIEIFLILISF